MNFEGCSLIVNDCKIFYVGFLENEKEGKRRLNKQQSQVVKLLYLLSHCVCRCNKRIMAQFENLESVDATRDAIVGGDFSRTHRAVKVGDVHFCRRRCSWR